MQKGEKCTSRCPHCVQILYSGSSFTKCLQNTQNRRRLKAMRLEKHVPCRSIPKLSLTEGSADKLVLALKNTHVWEHDCFDWHVWLGVIDRLFVWGGQGEPFTDEAKACTRCCDSFSYDRHLSLKSEIHFIQAVLFFSRLLINFWF